MDYKVAMAARTKVLKSLSQRTMQLRVGNPQQLALQCDGRKIVSGRVSGGAEIPKDHSVAAWPEVRAVGYATGPNMIPVSTSAGCPLRRYRLNFHKQQRLREYQPTQWGSGRPVHGHGTLRCWKLQSLGATPSLVNWNWGLTAGPVPPIVGCAWHELQIFE